MAYFAVNTCFVIAASLVVTGCSRPDLTEGDDLGVVVDSPALGFHMVDAGFWTNGTLRSDRISLESEDFAILFVYLPESGMYLVTIEKSDASVQSGRFVGSDLVFSGGRTEIRFRSTGGNLFGDGMDRDAWVEFLPGFVVSPSGADIAGPIVGLARIRSHVPGL